MIQISFNPPRSPDVRHTDPLHDLAAHDFIDRHLRQSGDDVVQRRQRLPVQRVDPETRMGRLEHARRPWLRHVLAERDEDRVLGVRLALGGAAHLGDVAVDEDAVVVLAADLAALLCRRAVGGLHLRQTVPTEIAPDRALPARVDAVAGCAAVHVDGGVEFRHAELLAARDDRVGQRLKEERHVGAADDLAVARLVLDAVDVEADVPVAGAAQPLHLAERRLGERGVCDGAGRFEPVAAAARREEVLEHGARRLELDGRGREGRLFGVADDAQCGLARPRHGSECDGHPPVHLRRLGPGPLPQLLRRVVPLVVAEVVVRVRVHCLSLVSTSNSGVIPKL